MLSASSLNQTLRKVYIPETSKRKWYVSPKSWRLKEELNSLYSQFEMYNLLLSRMGRFSCRIAQFINSFFDYFLKSRGQILRTCIDIATKALLYIMGFNRCHSIDKRPTKHRFYEATQWPRRHTWIEAQKLALKSRVYIVAADKLKLGTSTSKCDKAWVQPNIGLRRLIELVRKRILKRD